MCYVRLCVCAREKERSFLWCRLVLFLIFFAHFHQCEDLFLFPLGFCFLPLFLSGVVVTINLISSSRGFCALRGVSILSINSLDFIVDVFSERRLRIRFQIFLQLGHGRRADDARTDEIAVSNETQG
jgi:hypothetical protein